MLFLCGRCFTSLFPLFLNFLKVGYSLCLFSFEIPYGSLAKVVISPVCQPVAVRCCSPAETNCDDLCCLLGSLPTSMPEIASQKDIIQGPPTFFKPMFLVNVSPQRLEMCHLSNIYSDAIWLLNYLRFSRTNMDSEFRMK